MFTLTEIFIFLFVLPIVTYAIKNYSWEIEAKAYKLFNSDDEMSFAFSRSLPMIIRCCNQDIALRFHVFMYGIQNTKRNYAVNTFIMIKRSCIITRRITIFKEILNLGSRYSKDDAILCITAKNKYSLAKKTHQMNLGLRKNVLPYLKSTLSFVLTVTCFFGQKN